MPISEVFNMDCVEGMKQYPDKFFDLAVVDPPYTDDVEGLGAGINRSHFEYKYFKAPTREYIDELFRVSKNQVIWGFNHFLQLLPNTKSFIFWNKHQNGHFSEGEIAWASLGRARYFDRAYQKDIGDKVHPTQKPTKLYEWIFKNYGNPSDKILDTHMGSQSSRIAAFNMGFDYWGFELDKEYFEAGNKRFKEQTAQIQIF